MGRLRSGWTNLLESAAWRGLSGEGRKGLHSDATGTHDTVRKEA